MAATGPAAVRCPAQGESLRLAIFIFGPTGGGATRRTLTLAAGFAARGHGVELVFVNGRGALADELPGGVRTRVLDSPGMALARSVPWRSRRNQISASAFALARYLDTERPDVLLSAANHVHLTALLGVRLARTRVPLVLRVSSHLTRSHQGRGPLRIARLRLARRGYGRASAAIAVSSGIARDLLEHTTLTPQQVHTVGNPTVTPELLTRAQEPVEHPWLTAGGPPVVLGVGRLVPAKDFPTLLRAFARVREKRAARLVILGEGEQRARLAELATQLGVADDVALPGFVRNPFAWMSRASCFALSSLWEGSPGVLIEAMACGCPVVSTDCPSGPHEILVGGSLAPLVPVGDVVALARALASQLDEPPDTAPLRARAADFTVERAVDGYLDVLRGVA